MIQIKEMPGIVVSQAPLLLTAEPKKQSCKFGNSRLLTFFSKLANLMDKAWLLCLCISVLIGICYSFSSLSLSILLMLIAGIGVGLIISRFGGMPGTPKIALFRIYVVVFSLSTTAAFMAYSYNLYNNGTPYRYGLEDDDFAFDSKALELYQQPNTSDVETLRSELMQMGTGVWHVSDNYTLTIAWVYRVFHLLGCQPHPLLPRILNAMALAWITVLVFGISIWCGIPRNIAGFTAYLCGLFPYMLFYSLNTYRDILVSLGVIMMIGGVASIAVPSVSIIRDKHAYLSRVRSFVLFALGSLLLINLRNSYLFVIVLFVALSAAFAQKNFLKAILISLLIFIGFVLLFSITNNDDAIFSAERLWALEYYHERHVGYQDNITSKIFSLPYFISIPFRVLLRNISPLPLPQVNLFDNLERMGTIVWIFLLPLLLRGLSSSFNIARWRGTRAIRIVSCGFLLFFILNIMTTLQDRHIPTFLPAACIISSYQMIIGKNSIQRDAILTAASCICLSIAYFSWHVIS